MSRRIRTIEISKIEPNCRFVFEKETIEALVRSLREEGQIEPIRVWFTGRCFRIADGEKRWRASRKIGVSTIHAIIEEDDPDSETDPEE